MSQQNLWPVRFRELRPFSTQRDHGRENWTAPTLVQLMHEIPRLLPINRRKVANDYPVELVKHMQQGWLTAEASAADTQKISVGSPGVLCV